jgi:hypothetical protein
LLELRQRGSRCDDAATEPEGDAQTEATAIGNHYEVFDLIHEPSAALAVAVESVVDLFNITPNQRELSLYGVSHFPVIRRRHAPPQTPGHYRELFSR